jgi:UDPglucose 6-dehydrogenase
VVGYDPEAMGPAKAEVPDLETAPDAYEALLDAHCLVLCTEWDEFKHLNLERVKSQMAYPVVVDGRNMFEGTDMEAQGFTYYPTGRRALK